MDLIEIEKMIAEATVKLEAENAQLNNEVVKLREELAERDLSQSDLHQWRSNYRRELANLQQQLSVWKQTAEAHKENFDILAGDLRMKLAAAQADAARYAFIVSRFWDTDGEFSDAIDLLLAQETYPTKQQIDAAIDKAIEQKQCE